MNTIYLIIVILEFFLLSKALIVIRHRQVTEEMREILRNSDYPDSDPLNLKNLEIRQKICDEVIKAKEYFIVHTRIDAPIIVSGVEACDQETLVNFQRTPTRPARTNRPQRTRNRAARTENSYLVEKKVLLKGYKNRPMKLLECIRTAGKNWFVGFNGKDERKFLIERYKWHTRYVQRWTAFLDTKAVYAPIFKGPIAVKKLFHYFSEQVRSEPQNNETVKVIPAKMTLCWISFTDHARLCGASYETLRDVRAGYLHMPIVERHTNYIHIGQRRCMKKRVELQNPKEIFDADVLSCSVNRDQHSPKFFILADYKVAGAIFVLVKAKQKGYTRVKYQKLKLITRLEGLPIKPELDESKSINSSDSTESG